ncbi:MAG TPA: cysteine desulfurase NifS [Firmicutes bacterium]|nr:cysteine desulfurase NifS [Bacillota bacterium]
MGGSTVRHVYLDHAATTPTDPAVVEAMLPYFTERFGNPSSIYRWGREGREAVERARETVARILGAEPAEIIFTGGGSEADNLAIKGVALASRSKGNHIITSAIEHHAVYDAAKFLESLGFEITYVPVDQYAMVDPDEVRRAITPRTVLISIMHANNEVGTIQPIAEIGKIAREHQIPFHVDAVQTTGAIPVNVDDLQADLLSLSAHKFYGPKGVGALYVRRGVRLVQLIHGGGQERKRRAGTENVPGIVGLAKALELAAASLEERGRSIAALRDRLVQGIMDRIPRTRYNGHPTQRLPNNSSFCFEFVEGESLLLNLDLQGVAASSGSACTSGALEPSHVLLAMGLPHEIAHGSLRLTLGRENTAEDVDYVLDILPGIVSRLRAMSPLAEGKV